METKVCQGDIIKINGIKSPVLVVSKDFFNKTNEIIGCPISEKNEVGPLHILVNSDTVNGCVQCEKLTLLDLNVRSYTKIDRIMMNDIINITDAIQSIFDYI